MLSGLRNLKNWVDKFSDVYLSSLIFMLIGGVAYGQRNCNRDWDTVDAIPNILKKPLTVEKTCRFFRKRFLNYKCPKMVFGGHRPTRGKMNSISSLLNLDSHG